VKSAGPPGFLCGVVTLYPGLRTGASQVALFNLEKYPKFLQNLDEHSVQSKSEPEVVLSVDSHFLNLTPLNTPEGNIVAKSVPVLVTS
jgi:hypothetical protein